MERVRQLSAAAAPRLGVLLEQPGSREVINGLVQQLSRRFAARTIKFVFGAQQALLAPAGAGGAGGR